jgi:hypothetical protein
MLTKSCSVCQFDTVLSRQELGFRLAKDPAQGTFSHQMSLILFDVRNAWSVYKHDEVYLAAIAATIDTRCFVNTPPCQLSPEKNELHHYSHSPAPVKLQTYCVQCEIFTIQKISFLQA